MAGAIGMAALGGMALAAMAWATPAAAAGSGNLLLDGDGTAAACTTDWVAVTTVPGWTVTQGTPAVDCGSIAQFNTPGGAAPAAAFIGTGPWGDSALVQDVDLVSAAAAIDHGGVTFRLSGWLGGWAEYTGQAVVTATFLDAAGKPIGVPAVLSGVTAAARHDQSAFQKRTADGRVPQGARTVRVTLRFTDTAATFDDGFATNLSLSLSTPVVMPTLAPPLSVVPRFDHVFLVMMENTNFNQVIGDTRDAPFINGLAAQGTLLANYSGEYHPSDENYLAVAGGNTFVQGAIYFPDIHVAAQNIGDTLEAQGKTWRAYEQGMGYPCNLKNNYDTYYAPDDAPFINFTDIADDQRRCEAHLVDTSQLGPDLRSTASTPTFAWLAADDYYDGESSGNGSPKSLRVQDGWLRGILSPIFASPAWTTQKSLLVLTWDESHTYRNNHIATILYGSPGSVRAGVRSNVHYDHYSTGRTVEQALGLPTLTANDTYAAPINDAFARRPITQPTLSVADNSVERGALLVATYATPLETFSSGNRLAVYRVGDAPGAAPPVLQLPAPAPAGTRRLDTDTLATGDYRLFYLYGSSDVALAGPLAFTVKPRGTTDAAEVHPH